MPSARSSSWRPLVAALALITACGDSTAPGNENHSMRDFGFLLQRDGQFYLMPATGGAERAVLPATMRGSMPDVSPDGSRIAFVEAVQQPAGDYRLQIATIGIDGTGYRQVSAAGETGRNPRWAHDGSLLAFPMTSDDDTYVDDLVFSADAEGAAEHHVLDGPRDRVESLTWAPDGTAITYESWRAGLWTVSLDGLEYHQLTSEDDQDADWSPDGARLAFVRTIGTERRICILEVASSRTSCIASGWATNPRWSPDGKWLAYLLDDTEGIALYTMRPDFSDRRRYLEISGAANPYFDWVKLR